MCKSMQTYLFPSIADFIISNQYSLLFELFLFITKVLGNPRVPLEIEKVPQEFQEQVLSLRYRTTDTNDLLNYY